jgi:hypothetical protein
MPLPAQFQSFGAMNVLARLYRALKANSRLLSPRSGPALALAAAACRTRAVGLRSAPLGSPAGRGDPSLTGQPWPGRGTWCARVPMVCCIALVMEMAGLRGCSRPSARRPTRPPSSARSRPSVSRGRCRAMAPNPGARRQRVDGPGLTGATPAACLPQAQEKAAWRCFHPTPSHSRQRACWWRSVVPSRQRRAATVLSTHHNCAALERDETSERG